MDTPRPLNNHLDELRNRAIVLLISVVVLSGVCFYYIDNLIELLKSPAGGRIQQFAVFSPTEAILSFIKVSLFGGVALSAPMILYQVWRFIQPALDDRSAFKGFLFILIGSLLFFIGTAFSFFYLVPASLAFLLSVGDNSLFFLISLDSYLSFVLILCGGMGIIFEMPVLSYALSKWGLLTAAKMLKGWRVACVVILIAAAFITPTPDLVNMALMAMPMAALYIISIGIAKLAEKKK